MIQHLWCCPARFSCPRTAQRQQRAGRRWTWILTLALALHAANCSSPTPAASELPDLDEESEQEQDDELARPEGWSAESHSNDAAPDYEVVFPQTAVGRLELTIAAEDWQAMLDDLTATLGPFGQAASQPPPAGQQPPPDGQQPPADGQQPPADGQQPPPPAPGGQPPAPGAEPDPIYVPCTLGFNGKTWTQVGVRFKGFSSLRTSWQQGIAKLPLRLDLDQFEDEAPETKNQRLYGFQQLSLANAFHDPSFVREKVASDILRAAGVPAAQTAFYRVYLDHGEGATYLGLYTLVEVPDEPLLASQLGAAGGNLYKPDGQGADWSQFAEEGFAKKSNEQQADYSDVQAAITALHADRSDPAAWRAGLEATFDVDGFLRWLAVNTLIQNWDSYGNIAHNYYLYGDPEDGGRLRWIPWDHNEALTGTERTLSLPLSEVGERWPLIRYLMDDASYAEAYYAHLAAALQGSFAQREVEEKLRSAHALVEPYTVGAEGEQQGYSHLKRPDEFYAELQRLIDHVSQRQAAAAQALAARQ